MNRHFVAKSRAGGELRGTRHIACAMIAACAVWMILCSCSYSAVILIDSGKVLRPSIAGLGFESDPHWLRTPNRDRGISRQQFDAVFAKRWAEISPGFARIYYGVNWAEAEEGTPTWESDAMRSLCAHLEVHQQAGTIVLINNWYSTTMPGWLGGGHEIKEDAVRRKFARHVVDLMDYLITRRGFTCVRYFGIANELQTLDGWGSFDYESFRRQCELITEEMASRGKRGLFQLHGMDESVNDEHDAGSLSWAPQHMAETLGLYGAHLYSNSGYSKLRDIYARLTDEPLAVGKETVIGEFGGRTASGSAFVQNQNNSIAYGRVIARHSIAGLQSRAWAMGYWVFNDIIYPDDGNGLTNFGLFHGVDRDFTPKPEYTAYALLCRAFGAGVTTLETVSDTPDLHAVAARHPCTGAWSVAILNESDRDHDVKLLISGPYADADVEFRRWEYTEKAGLPAAVCGDLPPHSSTVTMTAGVVSEQNARGSLVILTSGHHTVPPTSVANLEVTSYRTMHRLQWSVSRDTDACYYRLYAGDDPDFTPGPQYQFASTVATTYIHSAPEHSFFKVAIVDRFGNVGTAKAATSRVDSTTVVLDACEDLERDLISENLTIEPSDGAIFLGDTCCVRRVKEGPAYRIYEATGLKFAEVVFYFFPENTVSLSYETSPDGATWTPVTHTVVSRVPSGSRWIQHRHAIVDPPEATRFLKVQIGASGQTYNPQLGEVSLYLDGD